jgi:transketolase
MTSIDEKTETLYRIADEIRMDCLRMGVNTGSNGAHFGGGLSLVEIMAVLYGHVMRIDSNRPRWEGRDRFILSKGHGAMAYYAALKQAGFVSDDELMTFKSNHTFLYGHPSMNVERGIEFSSGSLGLGLALGAGTALGLRLNGNTDPRVYVLLGDGECNEGTVWESAIAAAHFGLSNLTVVIDKNGLQYDGATESILNMGDLANKFESFGWFVQVVNGHDIGELQSAFSKKSDRPSAIVANTIKGKGVPYMENNATWHHNRLSQKQFDEIVNDREKQQ